MIQDSQLKDSLLLLGIFILLIAIFVPTFLWSMRKTMKTIRESSQFNDQEVAAVQHQMFVQLVGVPSVLLFFSVARFVWDQPTPYVVVIGFTPIVYIAVSSIRNRVSIFGWRKGIPVRGAKAIWSGVLNLILFFIVIIAFAAWL